jgi:endonuclease I
MPSIARLCASKRRSSARSRNTRITSAIAALFALPLLPATSEAAYEVPGPGYAPPANYYNTATGTGSTLRTNLHNIISSMTQITYGDVRYAFPTTDADPNHSGNIYLVYTQQSFSSDWGTGSNYSREHLIPVSWLGTSDPGNTYHGIESDLFELRPINQSVNSSRGNNAYGQRTPTGTYGATTGGLWYPGDWDAGQVARSMFYMATRYYDGTATPSINNLQFINGQPANGSFQIGDLTSLLQANYAQGVDNFERNRNQVIYSGWTNVNTSQFQVQGNRNPFIDHPEYTWAIFGTSANDSQISVATPNADGSSSTSVDLGRIMRNGSFSSSTVTVNKTGADPTTFDLTTAGNATTIANGANLLAGPGQPMYYGAQTAHITVGLNAATSSTGLKSGSLTIDDTDLTSAAAGEGNADGNDTVQVSGAVLDKRTVTPSSPSISLGTVIKGASINQGFSLGTTGDDNSFTRVNVAGSSPTDTNGLAINGTTALFNSAASTSNRSIVGTLTSPGADSGSLSLGVTTAENGGAGLAGEGTYSSTSINYSATVLDHSNASFDPNTNSDVLNINFGDLVQNSGPASQSFNIANLITTLGYTAGLDLTNISSAGSTQFSTDVATFLDEAAGQSQTFHAFLSTSTPGSFTGSYTFSVSDEQDLPGAIAGPSLTLNLTGHVIAVPEPATILVILPIASGVLLRRRGNTATSRQI